MPPIDDETLAGLSQEERDALAADDTETDELTELVGQAADDSGGDATSGADNADPAAATGADAGGATKPTAADADATAAAASAAADQTVVDDGEDEQFIPQYVAKPVENYDQRIADLKTKEDEVRQQFKDGDIDADQFAEALGVVKDDRAELQSLHRDYERAVAQNQGQAEQRWAWEIGRLKRAAKEQDGIDYGADAVMLGALDSQVKALANQKGADGKLVHADKPMRWFLTESHRLLKARFSGTAAAGTATNGTDGKPAARPDTKRRPNLSAVPRSVADAPNAGGDDETGADEFAALDGLSGIELENALARMPAADADRYLRAG